MFEHRSEPLLPRPAFVLRFALHAAVALGIVSSALAVGIIGYHTLEDLSWIDATVNAAMILGGMGPVNELQTTAGKLFAAAYALFSGLVFLVIVGILFAPIAHRFLHKSHLEMGQDNSNEGGPEKKRVCVGARLTLTARRLGPSLNRLIPI